MKEFITKNNKKRVVINIAPVKVCKRLKNVIEKEMSKYPLGLKLLGGAKDIFNKDVDFSQVIDFIKNVVISIDTSDEFEAVIQECLSLCTYDNSNIINDELFDKIEPEARSDYYEILIECVKENLRPFGASLVSLFQTHIGDITESLNLLQNEIK